MLPTLPVSGDPGWAEFEEPLPWFSSERRRMTDAFGKKLEVGDITVSCMSGPDGVFVDIGKVAEIQDEDISIEQSIGHSFHHIIMKVGSGNADLKTILNHVLRDLPGGMPEIRYTDD